ncbi:MAG: RNA-binding component of cleavage and polyadenylation factor [Phylliscum demangeonii]|nr:MAG: RNA-binding component of cleavage and polyadenylation factor [Phylliscum demangeonii]
MSMDVDSVAPPPPLPPPPPSSGDAIQQLLDPTHASHFSFAFSDFLRPTWDDNSLVCKHWLRGLCKKGDACEFLHEYNLRKMPECNAYTRTRHCLNGDECLYLHIDPDSRLPPCPHYDKGFCPLGPLCAKKHVRKQPCAYYLAGFCPEGRQCGEGAHPKWPITELPPPTVRVKRDAALAGAPGAEPDGDARGLGGERGDEREREREWERERDREREGDGDRDRDRDREMVGDRNYGAGGRRDWSGRARGWSNRGRGGY